MPTNTNTYLTAATNAKGHDTSSPQGTKRTPRHPNTYPQRAVTGQTTPSSRRTNFRNAAHVLPDTTPPMDDDDEEKEQEVGPTKRRLPPGKTLADVVRQSLAPPGAPQQQAPFPSPGGRSLMNRSTVSSGSSTDVPMATLRRPRPTPNNAGVLPDYAQWSSGSSPGHTNSVVPTTTLPPWEYQDQQWGENDQQHSSSIHELESNFDQSSPPPSAQPPMLGSGHVEETVLNRLPMQQGYWKAYQAGGTSWRYSPHTLCVFMSDETLEQPRLATFAQAEQQWHATADFHHYHAEQCCFQPEGEPLYQPQHPCPEEEYLEDAVGHEDSHLKGKEEDQEEEEADVVDAYTLPTPSPMARSLSPTMLFLDASLSAPTTAIPSPLDQTMFTPILAHQQHHTSPHNHYSSSSRGEAGVFVEDDEPATLPTTPRRDSMSSPSPRDGFGSLPVPANQTPHRNASFNKTPPTLRRRPPAGYIGAVRSGIAPSPPSPIRFGEETANRGKKKTNSTKPGAGETSPAKVKAAKATGYKATPGKKKTTATATPKKNGDCPPTASPARGAKTSAKNGKAKSRKNATKA